MDSKAKGEAAAPQVGQAAAERAQVLTLIRGWKWFAYLPAEAHDWLADRAIIRQIEKDRVVYVSGDPVLHVFAVIEGVFRIYMSTPVGHDITLEEVVAGAWFPHHELHQAPAYYANCVCHKAAVVACFSHAVMAELSRRWPGYYKGLYDELTGRAVVTLGRIELLSVHGLDVRLAVYFLRMARLRGRQEPDGTIWIDAIESQAELGARAGGARQRVNRTLNRWVEQGILEHQRNGTRILDLNLLQVEAKRSGFDVDRYLSGWHGGWQGKLSRK